MEGYTSCMTFKISHRHLCICQENKKYKDVQQSSLGSITSSKSVGLWRTQVLILPWSEPLFLFPLCCLLCNVANLYHVYDCNKKGHLSNITWESPFLHQSRNKLSLQLSILNLFVILTSSKLYWNWSSFSSQNLVNKWPFKVCALYFNGSLLSSKEWSRKSLILPSAVFADSYGHKKLMLTVLTHKISNLLKPKTSW